MGEKGIGRLAIATVGPIVLVITRPKANDGLITVSLIHWKVFELPGVDLSQIEIPVKTCETLAEIDDTFILSLKDTIKSNLDSLKDKHLEKSKKDILKSLKSWTPPIASIVSLPYGPNLNLHGTQFIISPVDQTLIKDIEDSVGAGSDNRGTKSATNLQRMLLGFSDSLGDEENVPIKTEFRDHLLDGRIIERVGSQEFFTPSDHEVADHRIEGEFDVFGNFKGTLSIYRSPPKAFDIILNTSGKKLSCGPFSLGFSYVQGQKSDTQVPFEIYSALTRKLDKIGGLYIYKNGIRVLPYGNSDYDFLEIERRRNLGAAYYFFSYRRMFGSIHITTNSNNNLHEKAGREGFQSNIAYRQFRQTLMSFFEKLAERYFREDGVYADEWAMQRESLQREYKISQKRKQQSGKQKKRLAADLEAFFSMISNGIHETEFEDVVTGIQKRLTHLTRDHTLENVAEEIIRMEIEADLEITKALDKYSVKRPRATGLTKKLEKEWRAYQLAYENEILPRYNAAKQNLTKTVGRVAESAKIHLDSMARLKASLDAFRDYTFKKVEKEHQNTTKALSTTKSYVESQLSEIRKSLQETNDQVDREILGIDFNTVSDSNLHDVRTKIEAQLYEITNGLSAKLTNIRSHLNKVDRDSNEAALSSDEAIASLETELAVLRDDYSDSLELAQLGMAISVVHHEFESNVKSIRTSLQQMHRWASSNSDLKTIYNSIRDGFDHLDNYLSLFTPLDKRLRRRKTEITGETIYEFIKDLFGEKLSRHKVKLEPVDSVLPKSVIGYSSVLLPVFVNLIDNSIHWLSHKDGDRKIYFGATEKGFYLLDNGPGVSERDLPFIFDFGYSTKHGGQGMGLYIAKTSLNKDGFDIQYDENNLSGAKFYIETLD